MCLVGKAADLVLAALAVPHKYARECQQLVCKATASCLK